MGDDESVNDVTLRLQASAHSLTHIACLYLCSYGTCRELGRGSSRVLRE